MITQTLTSIKYTYSAHVIHYEMNVNHVGGVMVSMLPLSTVDRGFAKDSKMGICCFSTKHTAGWLRIRIICLSGAHVYCCFGDLTLLKSN